MMSYKPFLATICLILSGGLHAQKSVSVFFNLPQGSFKNVLGTNAGPDSAVKGYKEMRIPTVRVHDYYGPGDYYVYAPTFYNATTKQFNASFNTNDSLLYDFKSTDNKISHLTNNGFTPFFRLGISYPSSTNVPTEPPANISADPLFTKFAGVCAQTVRHYTKGWNKGYSYNIPYWEIWNEPNLTLFWSGSNANPMNFYKMYKSVADSIKSVNPNLKVGGPGLAYLGIFKHQVAYYDSLISYCSRSKAAMDFYSWHLYECYNPYAIKAYGDTVRQILDKYNFTSSESIITEINPKLEGDTAYNDKPKGAAYAASVLMMTQDAPVDRIFWYRGLQLGKMAKSDTLGAARLAWNGFPFKVFGQLIENCPIRLSSPNNEIITNSLQKDTTNFMVMAGKSLTGDTVELMISNLNSSHTSMSIALKDVSWPVTASMGVSHTRIQAGYEYKTSTTSLDGWNNTFQVDNAASPSVHYIRFTRCSVPKPLISKDGAGNLISSASSGNQWYRDGVLIQGAVSSSYKPSMNGNYTVKVLIDGCSSQFSDTYNYVLTPVLDLGNSQYLRVYPNPAASNIYLDFQLQSTYNVNALLFDMNGKMITRQTGISSGKSISVKGLAAGNYILKILRENGQVIHQTMIIHQ